MTDLRNNWEIVSGREEDQSYHSYLLLSKIKTKNKCEHVCTSHQEEYTAQLEVQSK